MKYANPITYLNPVMDELEKKWPGNQTVNIICHGHSVPSGYFATPFVNSFEAYPHLLHRMIKSRFPFAVINVIVTAIGGENSASGAERFDTEVLNHNPQVITIDYGLNDRFIGLENAKAAWIKMIEKSLARNIKVILMTPSWDQTFFKKDDKWKSLVAHTEQIRGLAEQYQIGLVDTFVKFEEYVKKEDDLVTLLSHGNHPSRTGHDLIATELAKFFLAR